MNTTEVKRYFREICGNYHPTETDEAKRFTLPVNGKEVPNFIKKGHKAIYPQTKITSFIGEGAGKKTTTGDNPITYTKSAGEQPFEDPNVEYYRSGVEEELKNATFQLDIYSKDSTELTQIKDALEKRIKDFFNVEIINYDGFDPADWEKFNSIWKIGLDTSFKIIRMFDGSSTLNVRNSIDEVEANSGSWYLDDTGLYVNPITNTSNINYWEVINGEVFSDLETAKDKGFGRYKIKLSRYLPDKNPELERWVMEIFFTFRKYETKNVGRTIGRVDVNAETR